MVSELKNIALYKLHKDLLAMKLTDESIDYLVELVLYVYSNTGDEGDILKGTSG